MKKLFTFLSSIFLATSASAGDFVVGQVWEYQTRQHESESKLTIVQVDSLKGQEIIHISLEGLRIKNPQAPKGYGDKVSHLPISPEALKSSVTTLVGQTSVVY